MPPSSKVFNIPVTDRAFDFKYYDFYFYILKTYPVKILLKSFCLGINGGDTLNRSTCGNY